MFSRKTFPIVFFLIALLTIGWWIFLQLFSDHDTPWNYLFNLMYGLPFLAAGAWILWRCWQWKEQGHSDTVAFTFFGIGLLFYAAAQGIWTYYNFRWDIEIPTPSLADYFYGSTTILEILAFSILLFHRKRKNPVVRPMLVLLMSVSVAASFFVTFFVFRAEEVGSAPFGFDAFYTGTSLVTIFLLLLNIYREWHQELRPFLFTAFLAATVSGFGDLLFAFRVNGDTYWNGDVSDGLFAISSLLYFFSVCRFLPRFLTHSKPERREQGFLRYEILLPAGLIFFGFLMAAHAAQYVYTIPIEMLDANDFYFAALIVFVAIVAFMVALSGIIYLVLAQQVQLGAQLAIKTRTLQEKIAELGRSKFYLDRVSDGVLVINERGRMAYANHAVCHLFDVRVKDVVGRTDLSFLGKTVVATVRKGQKMLRQCDDWETEASFLTSEGITRDLLLSFIGLREDDHERIGILILLRDITERKAIERAKSKFVSMASHQLRAPMTQLRWLVEQALNDAQVSPHQREELESMEKIILLENKFVKDLLNLSRIERGTLTFRVEDVSIVDVISDAVRVLEKDAQDAKVFLDITRSSEIIMAHIDREKIVEAIRNIVHNAIKYTPAGGTVRVQAGVKEGEALVTIADEGPGIPEALCKGLFDIKMTPSTDPKAGAGLGLYLSKNFVEAVGGRLWFETSPNGTVFFMSLPLARKRTARSRKSR